MLPSFVIGLREGLEAALIVGIIAAFLRKQGRRDLLRSVLIGVGVAVALCLAAGIALRVFSANLPQKQQEGLETVIAVVAVGMVTYMVVWMRRNSRNLKGQLEGLARDAMAGSSNAGRAMVAMAFLAVIREGLETVVFLLAAFNESSSGASAGVGATLGIVVAIGLGYGIYRGGVRLNLSKFFRATGLVLVLVAAGLVVNAFHTAHEAGWVDFGQMRTVDLTWLVEPGTVQASLLTGMLGLQPRPVLVEVVAWLAYLIPVGLYVAWPPGRPAPTRTAVRGGLVAGVVLALAAVGFAVATPSAPAQRPSDTGTGPDATVVRRQGAEATVRTSVREPVARTAAPTQDVRIGDGTTVRHEGITTQRYTATRQGTSARDLPTFMTLAQVAGLNQSRPPIGIQATNGRIPVRYDDRLTLTVWVDVRTDRVIDLTWSERIGVVAGTAANNARLADPVESARVTTPTAARAAAVTAARADHDQLGRRSVLQALTAWSAVLAGLALLVALGFALAGRRREPSEPIVTAPTPELVKH